MIRRVLGWLNDRAQARLRERIRATVIAASRHAVQLETARRAAEERRLLELAILEWEERLRRAGISYKA